MSVEQDNVKSEQQLEFLLTVLRSINDSNADPDVVYPLLQNNLALLNDGLIEVLKDWAMAKFAAVDRDSQKSIAFTIGEFGDLVLKSRIGDEAINLELTIACMLLTLKICIQRDFPRLWAKANLNLAFAYTHRIRGDRADNLDQSINYYRAVLEIVTVESFPSEWAGIQVLLAQLSIDRLRNYQAATEHLQAAHEQLSATPDDTEVLAHTMFELARCFHQTGTLSQAKTYFKDAIRLYQRLEQPTLVAAVTSELGNLELQMGQIDEAKIHLQTALEFYQTVGNLQRIASIQELQKYLPVSSDKIAS